MNMRIDLIIPHAASHFEVQNIRPVEFGRIRWQFDLEVGPIRLRDCVVVVDQEGRPQFAKPGSTKNFRGLYSSLVDLDRGLAADVLSAVLARLSAEREQSFEADVSSAVDNAMKALGAP